MEDIKMLNDDELDNVTGGLFLSHNGISFYEGVMVRCLNCDSVYPYEHRHVAGDMYQCPVCKETVSIKTE